MLSGGADLACGAAGWSFGGRQKFVERRQQLLRKRSGFRYQVFHSNLLCVLP